MMMMIIIIIIHFLCYLHLHLRAFDTSSKLNIAYLILVDVKTLENTCHT